MDKLGWVLLPIVLAAAAVAVLALRGRMPSRQTLNVASSLLLLAYVAATAGLGIFWVANQHLPVFDWHYLFGYALVGLVVLHLAFNLRVVVQHLRRRPPRAPIVPGRRPMIGWLGVAGAAAAGGLGLFVGWRQGRSELRVVAATASAPGAGGGSGGADDALALVEKFHAVSSHSRSGAIARAPSVAWGEGPPPFKPLVADEVLVLPAPTARPLPDAKRPIDVATLGVLLWHTAGVSAVRGGLHLRTAPSSGALFATELYVIARRVANLAPGVWHYAPQRHALARLRAGEVRADTIGLPPAAADADALVVATALFRRSGRKYGDRTYRYVLADLGHALENLRVAADEAGARFFLEPRFDGARAAAVIGVDEAEEGVLGLARLGAARQPAGAGPDETSPDAAPNGTPGAARSRDPRTTPVEVDAAGAARWRAAPLAAGTGAALGITDAVHRATSLRRDDDPPRRAAPEPPVSQTAVQGVPLPRAAGVDADRLDVIARRRSQRRYAAAALAQQDLDALLAAMSSPPPQLSAAVRIHVLTPAVNGLPPRAWRWDAAGQALIPATDPDPALRRRARAAALDQDVVGDAAAVFVLTVDRAAFAADPAGPARGYRHAFLEAGMVGERVYLEAGARGLAVCAVGAFYDDEAAKLIAVDPAREWPVHFVALGVPG